MNFVSRASLLLRLTSFIAGFGTANQQLVVEVL